MSHAVAGQHIGHSAIKRIDPVELAVGPMRIACAKLPQPAPEKISEKLRSHPVDMRVGEIGVIACNQRSFGIRAAITDSSPGQHPRALRFNDVRAKPLEHFAHRPCTQNETVVRAAAHLLRPDFDPDMAAPLDHAVFGAGHDLQ